MDIGRDICVNLFNLIDDEESKKGNKVKNL
jgi:hypothetical protein